MISLLHRILQQIVDLHIFVATDFQELLFNAGQHEILNLLKCDVGEQGVLSDKVV